MPKAKAVSHTDLIATEATGVLQLHTALLIVPVLQTDGEVGLIPAVHLRITVEGLTACHHVEGIHHRDTHRGIATTAAHVAVLTAEPLGTDAGRTRLLILTTRIGSSLILGTDTVTVTLVVVAHLDVRVPGGSIHSTARTQVTGCHEAQPVDGAHLEFGDEVLLVVQVLTVDTLTTHQCQFVMEHIFEQVTIDLETHVTTVVHTVQGVRTFTSQIEHGLRIHVDQLQLGRREGVLHRKRGLKLSQTHGQFIVLRQTIVGVELLYHTREIMHKQKRPSVSDACLCP